MRRYLTRLAAVLCCVAICLCAASPAAAAQTEVSFDGVLYRLEVANPELLLSDAGPLLPGDAVDTTVYLRNGGDTQLTFYLNLAGTGEDFFENEQQHAHSLALLEQLHLEIALREVDSQGNIGGVSRVIYSGPASGSGLDGYVQLTELAPNGWAVLGVSLRVPVTLGNAFKDSLGALDWSFLCSYDDGGDTSSENPGGSTGGGGSGGSPNNGGQAGGGDVGSVGGFAVIEDGDVPLGIVEIVDDEVPLGNLPKTGFFGESTQSRLWIGAVGLILLGSLLLFAKARKTAH